MKQKRNFICSMAAFLLCAVMLCVSAFAAPSLKAPSSYCYDGANVLTEATKQSIEQMNTALSNACGAQIAVVTVNDTEGYSLEQYTYGIFNTWKIGDKDKNNGVLLMLDIAGEDYQCLQGSGLESSLPTPTISRILREELEPDFAARGYDAGVQKTFAALVNEVAGIYGVDKGALGAVGGEAAGQTQPDQTGGTPENDNYNGSDHNSNYNENSFGGIDLFGMLVFLVAVILVISSISGSSRRNRYGSNNAVLPFLLGLNLRPYRRYNSHHTQNHTPPPFNPGNFNGGFGGGGLFGGGSSHGGGFGGGGFGGGGFGGGGFGGFGGGGSRGGGAGRGH